MKVIFDTNIWIFFIISDKLSFIDNLLRNRLITIVYSDELLIEINDVCKREKFRKYFSIENIELIVKYIKDNGIKYKVTSKEDICDDKKDNFLLNLAIDSYADYIISGDKLLAKLEKVKSTQILTFSQFKDKLELNN